MGSKQRLVYTDSQGDLQVLAERRGSLGKAQRIIHKRRGVGYDWAKLHGSNQLFDSIPVGASEFQQASNGQNEPEIFLQDYQQGSWVDFARIYAEKGAEIQEEGKTIVKFWGFDKYIGGREVSVTSSQDIVDVMEKALPAGYVLDYPTDVTHPSVTNYSNEGKLNSVFQDMWDKYNYAIDVKAETDSNGNYKVRFEPVGYGGAVDDIKTAEGDVMRRWNNNDTGKIVNKVTVIGKDSNGQEVNETVTDQPSIDEYGEKVHPQNPIHVDYPISSSEAQSIGQGYIEPDPVSHGRARANLYQGNVFNDSVRVVDPQRGIEDTFTVTAQKTYFDDDTATELDLDFEQEGLEHKARGDESLWSERAKLYASETKDVGSQPFSGTTGDAKGNTTKFGGVGKDDDRSDDKSNVGRGTGGVQNGFIQMEQVAAHSQLSQTLDDGTLYTITDDGFNADIYSEPIFIKTLINDQTDSLYGTRFYLEISLIFDDGASAQVFRGEYATHDGQVEVNHPVDQTLLRDEVDNVVNIDKIEYEIIQFSGSNKTADISMNLFGMEQHTHGDNINPSNNDMGLTDNIFPIDNDHGGGSGDDQHGTSGSTDSDQDINVIKEVNTNREQ